MSPVPQGSEQTRMTQKTILRVEHNRENPFMMLDRAVPKNKGMSYEALGMLVYLLSQPDDWTVMPGDLEREGCGRDKVYRILRELRGRGHVQMEQPQIGHRFGKQQYTVHERPKTPQPEKPEAAQKPQPEKPETPEPEAVKPPPIVPLPEKPEAAISPGVESLPEMPDTANPLPAAPDTGSPYPANPQRHSNDSLQSLESDRKREETEDARAGARESSAAPGQHSDSVLQSSLQSGENENIFSLYLDNGFEPALDNDLMRDALLDAQNEYPLDQIKTAFREAVESGVRQWKYVKKILIRLQADVERAEMIQRQIADAFDGARTALRPEDAPSISKQSAFDARSQALADVPAEVTRAWDAAYRQLELQIDRASFNTYLRDVWLVGFEAGTRTFVFGVSMPRAQVFLQHRLYRSVERLVRDCYDGKPVALRFEVSKQPLIEVDDEHGGRFLATSPA